MDDQRVLQDEIEGLGIDFREVLTIGFRHWKLITITFLLTVGLTTTLVYLVPPMYTAQAQLLVQRNAKDVEEGENTRPVTALERGELLATEADILTSPALTLRCLEENRRFDPTRDKKDPVKELMKTILKPLVNIGLLYTSTDPVQQRIRSLLSNLEVTEDVDANTIDIEFQHDNPEKAAKAVNLLIDTYLRMRIEMLRQPKLEEHFQAQMAAASERLNDVEARRIELEVESGLVDPEVELSAAVNHLAQMRTELIDLKINREGIAERLAEIERLQAQKPKEEVVRREVALNPAWGKLDESISNLQRKLALLKETYVEGAEPIEQVRQELEVLRRVQEETPRMITTAETLAPSEAARALERERDSALIALANATRRIEVLGRTIEEVQQELRSLNRRAAEIARADAELLAMSKTYNTFVEQREAAVLARAADPGQVNVKVISYARVPDKPNMPRLIPILLSFVVGGALGIAIVVVLEILDSTVRNARDVRRAVGVPVLAELTTARS